MTEYITKGQALYIISYAANTGNLDKARKLLESAPTAPIAYGEWIGVEGDGYAEDENGEMQIVYDVFECSNCGCEHHADGEPRWAYCPDCGSKMDLEPCIWEDEE